MLTETLEYLGIAFISSALLIIMSKIILQSLIRRPADYYDAEELRQEELMLNAGGISIESEHETTPEGEIMEETHLEAHLSDFVAAEPEEIHAVTEQYDVPAVQEQPEMPGEMPSEGAPSVNEYVTEEPVKETAAEQPEDDQLTYDNEGSQEISIIQPSYSEQQPSEDHTVYVSEPAS